MGARKLVHAKCGTKSKRQLRTALYKYFARWSLLASESIHGFSHPCYINIECPDDRYPKLKICIAELILDGY